MSYTHTEARNLENRKSNTNAGSSKYIRMQFPRVEGFMVQDLLEMIFNAVASSIINIP